MAENHSFKTKIKKFVLAHIASFLIGTVIGISLLYNFDYLFVEYFGAPAVSEQRQWVTGRVDRIKDGDSIIIIDEQRGFKLEIRLKGIDTPEYQQDYGLVAKAELEKLLRGRKLKIRIHGYDRYDRILGTVFIGDQNINAEMVEQGHAWSYVFGVDDYEYQLKEYTARHKKRGLWRTEDPQHPKDWRKQNKEKK